METERSRFPLPADVVLRAKREKTQLNPCDVQWQGDLLQRMGAPVPAELVDAYRGDGIHIYEEDGVWWAAPMQADDI